MSNPRYSVGIDLGTTHCVLSYLDLHSPEEQALPTVLAIPQLIEPGVIEARQQLASFVYLPHAVEIAEGSSTLPWTAKAEYLLGDVARFLGAKTPIRLVSSAKSWLGHKGMDSRQPILPSEAPEDVERISPFTASAAYLQHLTAAWNFQFPEHPLQDQQVTITVPASFDPAAREMTIDAARSASLAHASLLEEPQAALYSWIESNHANWRELVKVGDVILVVDIGGGTSDFSLIAVTEEQGNLQLTRVAVGDHILLGGDNMDLALAYTVKAKIESQIGKRLEGWQLQSLTHACRSAKESLFNQPELQQIPIVIAGRGSSLIGGSLRSELTREELTRVLVEGFLPQVDVSEVAISRPRSGLRSTGLDYAQDAAITRHLAGFLSRQASAARDLPGFTDGNHASFLQPSCVLFNGGVLKASILAQRLLTQLNLWLNTAGAEPARLLAGTDLDLAVARGASYFGYVRQGKGVRIKGGLAAAYYVGVETAMPAVPGLAPEIEALCIAPMGLEEGSQIELPNEEFGLIIGEPVKFRFFGSKTRRDDSAGMRLEYWNDDELEELDEIEISLPESGYQAGEVIPVHLSVLASEVGTLELQAISRRDGQRWKIEFDARLAELI